MLVITRRISTLPDNNPLPRETLQAVHRAGGDVERLVPSLSNSDDAIDSDLDASLAHVHELGVVLVPVRGHLEEVVPRAALGDSLARPAGDGVFRLGGVEDEL